MTRVLITRIVVTLIGVAVWGYGQRTEQPQVRLAGIVILAVALLLRFAPKRWFGVDEP
jgi:chromate transport protein ChrA